MRVIIKRHEESGLWVCSDGRVVMPPCPQIRRFKHTWTYGHKDKQGYMRVGFRGKRYSVHRLIAETFLDNPEGYPTVDHINRDKTANFVENLRFASYKLQTNNRQFCEDSLAKYGVRSCDNPNAYHRAYRANNPDFAEQCRARSRTSNRARYAKDPKYAERCRTYQRERRAQQKALGKHERTCPDGKRRYLTDEEFFKEYGYWPKK